MTKRIITLAAGALAAALAVAGPGTAQDRAGRFTLTPANGGYILLDTETGTVSFCKNKDAKDTPASCELMPDSRTAMQKEIDVLKDKVKVLEEQLARGGDDRPDPRCKLDLPNEQEVDKTLDYMERMMRKFRERWRRMERGEHGDHGMPPPPNNKYEDR